jgi:hypothetical protein
VSRTKITGKIVKGFTPDELAWRHLELAIFGIEFIDCRTAARRVTLAEDLLKVAMKKLMYPLTHDIPPVLEPL